jgi:hypothetical protein
MRLRLLKNVLVAIGILALMASFNPVQAAGTKVTVSECDSAGGVLSDDVATGDIYCCFQGGSECYKCTDCISEDVIIFKKKGEPDAKAGSNLNRPAKPTFKQQPSLKKAE